MGTLRGSADIARLVDGLSSAPGRLAESVARIPEDSLDIAAEGEWSPRTVLAHLRDDEFMVMRPRLARMLVEDQPKLAPFDEKAWAKSRYRGQDSPEEILNGFRTQREASVAIIRTLTPVQLQRTGYQPEIGHFDIHWWIEHWLEHDDNHISQIRNTLDAV